jgi:hypothetical protein
LKEMIFGSTAQGMTGKKKKKTDISEEEED